MFHAAQLFVPADPGPGPGLGDDRSPPLGLPPEAPLAMPIQILEHSLRLDWLRGSASESPEEAQPAQQPAPGGGAFKENEAMTTPILRASLLALSVLAAGPVLAQATDANDETTTAVEGEATTTVVEGDTDAVETVTTTEDNRGFNLGWLGLLGLLGLLGRGRRRETVPTVVTHPTTVTTHPTTVTTNPTTVTSEPTAAPHTTVLR